MTTYYFDITEAKINSLTIEQYEALERLQDGDGKMYLLRPVLCHFMVDENGKEIPEQTALSITKKFSMTQMKDFVEQFFSSIKTSTVPKANGSPSSLPLEVKQVDSGSHLG